MTLAPVAHPDPVVQKVPFLIVLGVYLLYSVWSFWRDWRYIQFVKRQHEEFERAKKLFLYFEFMKSKGIFLYHLVDEARGILKKLEKEDKDLEG